MGCLDDSTALAFARGEADGDSVDAIVAHLDECEACRLLVATAAGGTDEGPGAVPGQIGRFPVEGIAGRGAMGIVYRGRDPRLDRVVALKVIRPEALAPSTRARFEREARALARISHPNVVGIYEVGDVRGSVYLAMEHLPGRTLADWLAEPRSTREIVVAFRQAGEGLLAAHRAGLVHRDFKPSNALIDGEGRVRVADFGLAHDGGEIDRDGVGVEVADDLLVTQTGMLIGTPAYMSPEQHEAKTADPRSDQFSFCVALFEALAGNRPFAAGDYGALVANLRAGTIEPPRRAIPRPILKALLRGLAGRPEDRFPSMRELLDALARYRRQRRARWLLAAAALAACAAGGAIWLGSRGGEGASAGPCADVDARWRSVWNDDREAHVSEVIEARWKPRAGQDPKLGRILAKLVIADVRAFGDEFASRYRETCRVHAKTSQARHRRACLGDALGRLGAFVAEPPVGALTEALAEVRGHLDRCGTHLVASLSRPAEAAFAQVEEARAALARSATLRWGGKLAEAQRETERAIGLAEGAGYAPALAEAWLEKGFVERRQSKSEDSIASHLKAVGFAQQARHHKVFRQAAENLAWQYYFGVSDRKQAAHWVGIAESLDGNVPPTEYERALRDTIRAHLLEKSGDRDGALELLEAVAGRVREHDLGADIGVRVLEGVVIMLYRARQFDAAPEYLATMEREFAASPRAAFVVARERGQLAGFRGRTAQSAPHFARAVELAPDDRSRAATLIQLAEALAAGGDFSGAETRFREALDTHDSPDTRMNVACERGELASERKRWSEAVDLLRECLRLREQLLSAQEPVVIYTLTSLGTAYHYLNKTDLAVDYYDRALARFADIGRDDDGVNAVRWSAAQILYPKEPDRARALARTARQKLAEKHPQLAETIRKWLAARK